MNEIKYLNGDATAPEVDGVKIIAHICNDIGAWGAGFVLAVSRRWKEPERQYKEWHKKGDDFELGNIQLVKVEDSVFVGNMIGQRNIRVTKKDGAPIRYEAVESCLSKLAIEANILNASVHMPRIGCGLAGGKWEQIEPLIISSLIANEVPVYVYDFE